MSRRNKKSAAKLKTPPAAAVSGSAGSGGGDGAPPRAPPVPASAFAATSPPLQSLALNIEWEPRVVTLPPSRFEGVSLSSSFERLLALPLGRLAPLFACFTTSEACPLRTVSRAAEAHVAVTPFTDATTPVVDLHKWRTCFPCAVALKLSPLVAWPRATAVYLRGLTSLDISGMDNNALLTGILASGVARALTSLKLAGCPASLLVRLLVDEASPPAVVSAAHEALVACREPWEVVEDTLALLLLTLRPGLPPSTAQARLALLATLTSGGDDALFRAVVDGGGVTKAISCLRAYKAHAEAATSATAILVRLLDAPAHAAAVAQAGAAPAALAALEAHPGEVDLAINVSALLGKLLPLAPSNAAVILTCGGPRLLLRVVAALTSSGSQDTDTRGAAGNACIALSWLLELSPERTATALLAEPRALDTLLATLAAHTSSPSSRSLAKGLLTVLSFLAEGPASAAVVSAAVHTASGAEAVLAAAAAHAANPEIVSLFVRLLLSTVKQANQDGSHATDTTMSSPHPLIAAGAVSALLAATAAFPAVAPQSCDALQWLLAMAEPTEVAQVLSDHPVVASTAAALVRGFDNPQLPPIALSLLYMCWEVAADVTRPQLASPLTLEAVVATLRLRSVDPITTATALLLLSEACVVDAPSVADLAGEALVEVLESATAAADALVIEKALWAVDACASSYEQDAVEALVNAGAAHAVVAAVAQTGGPSRAAGFKAARALHAMATHRPADVLAAGGVDALMTLSSAHEADTIKTVVLLALAAVADVSPPSLVPHVAAVGALAVAGLQGLGVSGFYNQEAGASLLASLVASGAPVPEIAVALRGSMEALTAAVGAASRALAAATTADEAEEDDQNAASFLRQSTALASAVQVYAGMYMQATAGLAE